MSGDSQSFLSDARWTARGVIVDRDLTDTHPQDRRETAAWRPRDVRYCRNCGGHVTPGFRITFGDEDNIAHACLASDCATKGQIRDGAARDPDYDLSATRSEYRDLLGSPFGRAPYGGEQV